MVDADYDPHGFVNFFAKLRDMQGARLPVWLSSHPLPQERIDRVEELIGSSKYEEARVGESAHSEIRRILQNDDQADGGGGMGMDAGVDDAGEADVGGDGD
jgi:predicted Zn-dependent protease